ncbi:hypothetical protein EDB86DRAFT_2051588 [Lactarius hatsudake]|nr:hypothetical protein EDB86DRAFT_2051588 [Lactarius hatsudake]
MPGKISPRFPLGCLRTASAVEPRLFAKCPFPVVDPTHFSHSCQAASGLDPLADLTSGLLWFSGYCTGSTLSREISTRANPGALERLLGYSLIWGPNQARMIGVLWPAQHLLRVSDARSYLGGITILVVVLVSVSRTPLTRFVGTPCVELTVTLASRDISHVCTIRPITFSQHCDLITIVSAHADGPALRRSYRANVSSKSTMTRIDRPGLLFPLAWGRA